jgi:hypothetical protein
MTVLPRLAEFGIVVKKYKIGLKKMICYCIIEFVGFMPTLLSGFYEKTPDQQISPIL